MSGEKVAILIMGLVFLVPIVAGIIWVICGGFDREYTDRCDCDKCRKDSEE